MCMFLPWIVWKQLFENGIVTLSIFLFSAMSMLGRHERNHQNSATFATEQYKSNLANHGQYGWSPHPMNSSYDYTQLKKESYATRGKKRFKCKLCGLVFSSSGIHYHMKAHAGVSYDCPVCQAQFSRVFSVKRHVRKVHNFMYCATCHCVYPQGQVYDAHIVTCMQQQQQ